MDGQGQGVTPVLELEGVSRRFRGPDGLVEAVRDVSLRVEPGEVVAVQGPSGSGKTTLLLMAGGLLSPSAGRVTLAGRDPYRLSPDARSALRAEKIGFVFQQFHLLPYLTVKENVLIPSAAHPLQGALDRARELIRHFDLEPRANHRPAQLSTGERQRTALARALLRKPALVLADEPTGNLDRENADRVLAGLAEFASRGGSVMIVTHDTGIGACASRVLRLLNGRLESGGAAL